MNYKPSRKLNLFSPVSTKPYKLSRSKINDYLNCPRCFYLDRRKGTSRPAAFPYTLNNAVDSLLKKEFDQYRAEKKPHPLFVEYGLDAIPFDHQNLDDWRMTQRGIQYLHEPTNFIIYGAIDDVWINPNNDLIVIADYKATSTKAEITLDNRESYKRQMEIYQWLFSKNGFQVSDTGYFVYCNADTGREGFMGSLQFKISLLSYTGDHTWVDDTLFAIKACLMSDVIPESSPLCDYCQYLDAIYSHMELQRC